MKILFALLTTLVAALALAACSEDGGENGDDSTAIPESEEFNQADVDFATDMIQHHAQALAMVDLTRDRGLSPEVEALAEEIMMAQGPEIETMTDWLTSWDQPVPETVRDHANAHGDEPMEMDSDVPGMMSAEDMAALEAAQGEEFERMWLEMMIGHHQGAIEMAQAEEADGEYRPATDLAGTITSTQQDEIDRMEQLLGS
jgi:uncharacterized protein (DUF305 family)